MQFLIVLLAVAVGSLHHAHGLSRAPMLGGQVRGSMVRIPTQLRAMLTEESGSEMVAGGAEVTPRPPGHSSSFPVSVSGASRIELGRIILGIAVFWLTLKLKVKEVAESVASQGGSGAGVGAVSKIVALPGGVKYQDSEVGNDAPVLGDLLVLEGKVLYNGLELQAAGLDGVRLRYSLGDDDQELQDQLPACLAELPRAIVGMQVGGKRQLALPCPEGLPPYVPPGGVILCNVVLSKALP